MAGNMSVESCGNLFASTSREVSSNYGIGSDGRIALYVDEKDRSWCSSSRDNDHRAITIEVANDGGANTGWHVSDKAYAALIDLCVDICKRNNIKALKWKGDKSLIGQVDKQNMTVHRWFANKSCPGDYLYNLHGQIAKEVNSRLSAQTATKPSQTLYRVQTGAFSNISNADKLKSKLKSSGFEGYVTKVGALYKVQVGAYSSKSNAESMRSKLKAKGFDAIITTESGSAVSDSVSAQFSVGDKVKLKSGAPVYSTTKTFPSWVYSSTLYVRQISGNRVVISTVKSGDVTGAVDKKYLTKI